MTQALEMRPSKRWLFRLLIAVVGIVGWFVGFVLTQLLDDLVGAPALVLVPTTVGALVGLAVSTRVRVRGAARVKTLGAGILGALGAGLVLYGLSEAGIFGGGGLWLLILLDASMTIAAYWTSITALKAKPRKPI